MNEHGSSSPSGFPIATIEFVVSPDACLIIDSVRLSSAINNCSGEKSIAITRKKKMLKKKKTTFF
jgi:hypothetical protein